MWPGQTFCIDMYQYKDLRGVVITEGGSDVSPRAQSLLHKLCPDFSVRYPKPGDHMRDPELEKRVQQLLNEPDKLSEIQDDLEVTKARLIETLEEFLRRGDRLEHLISISDKLSQQSKDMLQNVGDLCNLIFESIINNL
jgi:hypothetical protein